MDVGLDHNVHTTYAIKLDFLVLVISPIAKLDKVFSAGVVFFVAFCENDIFVQARGKLQPLFRFDPRVVVDYKTISTGMMSRARRLYSHFPSISWWLSS